MTEERMTDELTHTDKELNHCPSCGGDNITYQGHFDSGRQRVTCGDCDAEWHEVWNYAGIVMFEEGKVIE